MTLNNSPCLVSEIVDSNCTEKNQHLKELLDSLGFKPSLEDLNSMDYLVIALEKIAIRLIEYIKNAPLLCENRSNPNPTMSGGLREWEKEQATSDLTKTDPGHVDSDIHKFKNLKIMLDQEILSQNLLFKKLLLPNQVTPENGITSNLSNSKEFQTFTPALLENRIKILHEINLKISEQIDTLLLGLRNPAFSFIDNGPKNRKIKNSCDSKIEFSGNFMLDELLFKFDVKKDSHTINLQSRKLIEGVRTQISNEIKRYDETREVRNEQQQKLELFLKKMF